MFTFDKVVILTSNIVVICKGNLCRNVLNVQKFYMHKIFSKTNLCNINLYFNTLLKTFKILLHLGCFDNSLEQNEQLVFIKYIDYSSMVHLKEKKVSKFHCDI